MSDNSQVIAALRALTDRELIEIICAVSDGRAGLAAVHAAATADSAPSDPTIPSTPEFPQPPPVPPTPEIPTTPDVPRPPTIGTVTAESVSAAPGPDYTRGGVPTFDRMRDKVEERFGTALGSEELDRTTPAGKSRQEQWSAREEAGHRKLDEIRKSLHPTGVDDQDDPKGNE